MASLFEAYKLGPVTKDLSAAAVIAATCYNPKNRTEDTAKMANALTPGIQKMFEAQSPQLETATTLKEFHAKTLTTRALRTFNAFAKLDGKSPLNEALLPSRVQLQKTLKST